jgi:hypothetical protein
VLLFQLELVCVSMLLGFPPQSNPDVHVRLPRDITHLQTLELLAPKSTEIEIFSSSLKKI